MSSSIVCEEVFDETSHPSIEEIIEYATKIGIDPDSEPQLLPLAAEGLMKALPPGWKPCYDERNKSYYYYNNLTGKTQWEHPLDDIYRGIVVKKRAESQSISQGEPTEDATYTRDDLPSYEEPPHMSPFSPKALEPLTLGARKKEIKLSPLKAKPKLGDLNSKYSDTSKSDSSYPKLLKQKSEDRPASGFANRKLNIHMFNSFDDCKEDSVGKSEFRLSGGGSMFLKSNVKKSEPVAQSPQSKENFLAPDAQTLPRGILRERSSILENSRSMEFPKSDKSDREDDDKKSVRFNLEKNPDITFDFSDRSFSDEELKDVKNEVKEIINVSINNKPKSRFTVSPVKDLFGIYGSADMRDDLDEQKEQNSLKLIKPHPTDFIKPRLESNDMSDSDDDSVLRSGDKPEKISLKDAGRIESVQSDNSLIPSLERERTSLEDFDDIFRQKREKMRCDLEEKCEAEMEEIRKTIWDEKNEELQKYKRQVQDSHKLELERILVEEKSKHEGKVKGELENLRQEVEARTTGALNEEKFKLEEQLEEKKKELQQNFTKDEEALQKQFLGQYEEAKKKLEKSQEEKLQLVERELNETLEKHKDELIVSHNAILDQIRQKHLKIIDELKKDFKAEELIIRKEHQSQLADLRRKTTADVEAETNRSRDSGDERLYEKVRCEKRLLEDKYRCLKEKYLRLKTDVKLTIEKRNRRREQSITTTGSETERSNSINKERSPIHSPSTNRRNSDKPPTPKHSRLTHVDSHRTKPEHKTTRQLIIQDIDTSMSDHSYKTEGKYKNEDSSDSNVNPGRSRKKIFSRLKSSSTSRINTSTKSRKNQRSCSPVENLRRQLQKLEDLEDQFPQNAHSDTYHLRYPFTDDQKFEGSSEMEFFRHRIHLERDSIKRAKESLRSQKCMFQQRQNELKLKHGSMARHTLQQLCQEEKELTDMEVSLHRTRSLLGEKVIRLRHLEQSLQRATLNDDQKPDDTTLSDLSSHSASSGISSTEFATADGVVGRTIIRGEHFQESSEIIQSLENLNSEIREIWEVLHKQQQAGNITAVVPPLPLVYPDLGWPVLAGTATVPAPPSIPTLADRLHNYRQHIALANAQSTVVTHATQGATTTLVERTRNLRHWLRQAGIDSTSDSNAPQATL